MPENTRPPAGGLDVTDDDGQILEIEGVRYRYTDAEGLVELERQPGTLTPAQAAEIDAAISAAERNPAGNPYRDGIV